MEIVWKYIFFTGLGVLIYNYFGYPFIAFVLGNLKKKQVYDVDWSKTIPVTVIIPAYNEAGLLQEKLLNTADALKEFRQTQIILITDGSNDGSENLKITQPNVLHLHLAERKGKSAAINRATATATGEIIVITDANAFINSDGFLHLISRFENEKTGAVSGEKKVLTTSGSTGGEGIYWKYESFVKLQSARLNTLTGAAGELIAFRKELFKPIPENAILDDLELSFQIIKQHKKIDYEPKAYVVEPPSKSINEEFSRKVRIAAGVFQTLSKNRFVFNPFRFPVFKFQFFSHRILRWIMGPVCLVAVVLSNVCIVLNSKFALNFFLITGILQLLFYSLVMIGFVFRNRKIPSFIFIPFYFIMTNWAIVQGFVRHLGKKESVLWKKASR